MPDVYDTQYAPQTLIALGKLMLQLKDNKATRPELLRAIKKHAPNYQLPTDMQVADAEQRRKDDEADREVKEAQKENERRLAAQRKGLLEGSLLPGRQFDEAQVGEIETLMQKHGFADYEIGAKLYASDLAPARPSGGGRPNLDAAWTLPEIPGLFEDATKAARTAAYNAIDELRGRR